MRIAPSDRVPVFLLWKTCREELVGLPRLRLACLSLVAAALGRGRGVSGVVGAVVVRQVMRLHVCQALLLNGAQALVLGSVPPLPAGAGRRVAVVAHATVQAREILERAHERRCRPVDLHAPALCRPVRPVPQARVQPHRLHLRERHAQIFTVLEHADGLAVDLETAYHNQQPQASIH